jgi:hypothetical protein
MFSASLLDVINVWGVIVRWLNCSNSLILTLGFALIIVSLVQMVAQRLGNGFANVNSYHVGKITQRCRVG